METVLLRVSPWYAMSVERVLELRSDQTLADLHSVIRRTFELGFDAPYTFFLNNEPGDTDFAYGPNARHDAAGTRLNDLELPQRKRFVYEPDLMGELRFQIVVDGSASAEEGELYPRVVSEKGDIPKLTQSGDLEDDYDDHDHDDFDHDHGDLDHDAHHHDHAECEAEAAAHPKLRALTPRVKVAITNWHDWLDAHEDDDDFEDEELVGFDDEDDDDGENGPSYVEDPKTLLDEQALALEILDETKGDPRLIHAGIEHAVGTSIFGWLSMLPERLAAVGHPGEAADLAKRLLVTIPADDLRFELPAWYAEAGRSDEARAVITENLDAFPEEARMLIGVGDAFVALDEVETAERHFQEAIRFAGAGTELRFEALARVLTLMEEQGRTAEAERVLARETDLARQRSESDRAAHLRDRGPKTAEPRVGRNDPCPCGSGKKFKKCCGGPDGSPIVH